MSVFFMILLILTAFFLIILVLIQRGKGGGLAGAFGGMGGQSAFGTKAGDLFTKITIGAAAVWIVLCIVSVRMLGAPKSILNPTLGGANTPAQQSSAPAPTEKPVSGAETPVTGGEKPATESPAPANKTP